MLKSVTSTLLTLCAVNAQVPVWGQCGGSGWTGSTVCVAAATCVYGNVYYSQCLPSTATTSHDSPPASSTQADIPVWGQCGGQGFIGSTSCVSGARCTYSNPWYSQCLPQTSSSTVTNHSSNTKAKPTTSSSSKSSKSTPTLTSKPAPKPTSSSSSAAPPTNTNTPSPASGFLGGVNLAGFDFSVFPDGSFSGTGDPPPMSQISHFSKQGVNIYRVPTAWQLVTPTLGGSLSEGWFAQYDAVIQEGLKAGAKMIIDIHNYARWNGRLIGESGGPTNAQFASLWSQIATKYKTEKNVIFGIMNEPHDLNSLSDWADSVQAAVNAIRSAGATSQMILIPGSSWSSAAALTTEAGPALLKVVDSDGTKSKLIFDVHRYLDSDNSGTSSECVTDNVNVLQTLVSWLQANGNRQALLSETGGGNTASCEAHLKTELAFVKANSKSIIGFTVWAAGSFQTSYTLAVTPNSDGSDMPLWTEAVRPNLP